MYLDILVYPMLLVYKKERVMLWKKAARPKLSEVLLE